MTVVSPELGEPFQFRIFKRLTNAPNLVWANTHEVVTTADGEGAQVELFEALDQCIEFERSFHGTDVEFFRATISTGVEDGKPYNPLTFVSANFTNKLGQRTVAGTPLDLNICLNVKRVVPYGRQGQAFYRRCLGEGDVNATTGFMDLDSGIASTLASLIETSGSAYFVAALSLGFTPAMVIYPLSRPGAVRTLAGYQLNKVTTKSFNNKFYNRLAQVEPQ